MTRVVLVEDHLLMVKMVVSRLRSLRGVDDPAASLVLDHGEALVWDRWQEVDVVLVDAYRHSNVRLEHPEASLLAGPEVAELVATCNPKARVVGYSMEAELPEVNITFRQAPGVVGLYRSGDLLEAMAEAVGGTSLDHQVRLPEATDHADLGVGPNAQIWEAIKMMRKVQWRDQFAHGDAWERVVQTTPAHKIEPRTANYIKNRVAPLLGIDEGHGRHRLVTAVLQRVTRSPGHGFGAESSAEA